MENNEVKYQTILANLQNIETNDSSLFSSVDNEKFFDVLKNFGVETFDNFYTHHHINHILKENSNRIISEKVAVATNKFEVISIFKEYNRRIDNAIFKALNNNFEKAKQLLLNNLETEFQKSIVKWKKILNNAKNINIETNIWPLHLGFFFISIKTDKKIIFAPLFFKEVTIRIENSLVYLESSSDIRINSKLITFLSQQGFMINVDTFNFSNATMEEVFNYFKEIWSPIYQIPETIKNAIPDLEQDKISNTSIEFHQGMVLGFYNVSSGYLWNQMKKIIENDEFDYILNPKISKVKYVETVKRVIFDKHFKLFKIQKTNFSQDCATISALYQDTIIWGPPGTGKSQTISNLIANIVAHGYSGLVVSQKKAALDVLKKRLKSISKFCLFALSDKHVQLDEFYQPLQKYIYELEHCSRTNSEKGISIFSLEDKNYVDTISRLHNNPNIDNLLQFYSALTNVNFSESLFENLKLLDRELKYEFNKVLLDKKSIMKHLYEVNLGKKPHFFTFYPSSIKRVAEILASDSSLFSVDIDKCLKFIDKVNYDSVVDIIDEYKNIIKSKSIELNNEKILSEMILEKKFEIVSNFSGKQLALYNDFTLSIRTAKLKPYLFFHRYREIIKLLFPIIITTPEIDLSMWEKEEFDYAILDESSQMFLEKGIPILYLAKRKILAGDSQQMQPTRWFSVTYNFDEEDELGHIESLLAYARNRGVFSILLNKNYRSKLAALMTFSSKHFYDSKLDVIDDYEVSLNKDKAIDVVQVNGAWNNSMNVEEGTKVIEIIKENLAKYKKIIVLVFNVKQQDYLMNLIFGNEPELENAINSGQISLKNIENIQGDEADLVIMSVVYDKNTSLYGTYVARAGGKNALNVAISRAREKIIVVKSIYADDVQITENSTTDMRIFKEWLKFLDLSLEEQKNYLDEVDDDMIEITRNISINEDVEYKKEILSQLQQLVQDHNNLKFISDYSIGTKTIDIVLINMITNKLIHGFIIDYYDYINNYENYLKFKDGIKFLESKAYPITIISKHEWPIKKYKIISEIKEKINKELIATKNFESDRIARQRPPVVIRSIEPDLENDDEIEDFHVEENFNKEKNIQEDLEHENESTRIIRLDLDIDNELELENQPKNNENIEESPENILEISKHLNRSDLHEVEIEADDNSKSHLNYNVLDEDEIEADDDSKSLNYNVLDEDKIEADDDSKSHLNYNVLNVDENPKSEPMNQNLGIINEENLNNLEDYQENIQKNQIQDPTLDSNANENDNGEETEEELEEVSNFDDLTEDIYYNTGFYDVEDETSNVNLKEEDNSVDNKNPSAYLDKNYESEYISDELKNSVNQSEIEDDNFEENTFEDDAQNLESLPMPNNLNSEIDHENNDNEIINLENTNLNDNFTNGLENNELDIKSNESSKQEHSTETNISNDDVNDLNFSDKFNIENDVISDDFDKDVENQNSVVNNNKTEVVDVFNLQNRVDNNDQIIDEEINHNQMTNFKYDDDNQNSIVDENDDKFQDMFDIESEEINKNAETLENHNDDQIENDHIEDNEFKAEDNMFENIDNLSQNTLNEEISTDESFENSDEEIKDFNDLFKNEDETNDFDSETNNSKIIVDETKEDTNLDNDEKTLEMQMNDLDSENLNHFSSHEQLAQHQIKSTSETELNFNNLNKNKEKNTELEEDDLDGWIYSDNWDEMADADNSSNHDKSNSNDDNKFDNHQDEKNDIARKNDENSNKLEKFDDDSAKNTVSDYLKEFNLMGPEESEDKTTEFEKYIGE
ncbi:ATP-binding protein [[Mycoplasma] phocae]|uniref:ATP-binding protein n=1 Tax=[Mycoplasma] phocae TaxID=142651 RepID=A0A2Z5IPV2_9BACT|nr:ATP-binding protein [[Mycoplasma] phocae]AXE60759.1 ATP-binding protein [[Mycoplasma] phocae]